MNGAWTIDPTKFADVAAEDHRQLCISVGLEIDRRLVEGTPIDTGRARSNWLPSTNTPRLDTVEPRSAEATMAEAQAKFSACKPYPLLYLANNLPYIEALNEGHSKQAPAGFVEAAIDAVGLNVQRKLG